MKSRRCVGGEMQIPKSEILSQNGPFHKGKCRRTLVFRHLPKFRFLDIGFPKGTYPQTLLGLT